jgi:hypothetical protein
MNLGCVSAPLGVCSDGHRKATGFLGRRNSRADLALDDQPVSFNSMPTPSHPNLACHSNQHESQKPSNEESQERPRLQGLSEWARLGSNQRPLACEGSQAVAV